MTNFGNIISKRSWFIRENRSRRLCVRASSAPVYFHKISPSRHHVARTFMETSDVTRKLLVENDRAVTMIARDPNNTRNGVTCKGRVYIKLAQPLQHIRIKSTQKFSALLLLICCAIVDFLALPISKKPMIKV